MCISIESLRAQEKVELYPNRIPNLKKSVTLTENSPELFFYEAKGEAKNKVFLIIPGGGYGMVAINHEGHDVAKRLQELGYHSFVLRYRLPVAAQMIDKRVGPIIDAQSALLFIRDKAQDSGWNGIEVGVIGFSAGGHLASTLSTHSNIAYVNEVEDLKGLRPDFSVLVYPVISMDDQITHKGSKNNLIGPNFKEEDVFTFSNDLQVTEHTPPTFLIHAEDDKTVPIENSFRYMKALNKNNVPNKLFKYELGGHGFGMYNKKEEGDWFTAMLVWLNNLEK